jgi:putative Holliday junction resolvase
MHKNYLALDIGAKRIGVAIGSVIPFGRGYIDATNSEEAIDAIKKIIIDENITAVVIGIPQVKSGDITASQKNARDWVNRVKHTFHLPVHTVDESFTSHEAENQLRHAKIDIKREKWRIDERAAELILGQFFTDRA